MRILVTGSRDWTDRAFMWDVLNKVSPVNAVIIHGACPTGADKAADEWVACQPDITVERYPADWEKYGKRAGFIRNSEMVNLGADICLAFIKDDSRGASMTALLAERAGIVVRRFELWSKS